MKRYQQTEVRELAEILKNDGVISVPTDTVYGVCARMDSEKAQERLRKVKNRPEEKAFPIMCRDKEQMKEIAVLSEEAEVLIDTFMPGPLTIILKKKQSVASFVNGGMPTLALRMATSEPLRRLIEETGCPIFLTSANQSGEKTARSLDEIEEACPLLDAMMIGDTEFGQASTIVDCTDKIRILRNGPISEEDIRNVLKEKMHA